MAKEPDGQSAQRERDVSRLPGLQLAADIQTEVLRGAETPDYFSTRPHAELESILRDTPGLGLDQLANTGAVRIDYQQRRIFHDSFWKGSFAEDSLLGWEQKVRASILGEGGLEAGTIFAGGSFWKRFESPQNGVVKGYVVNYEIQALPGLPEVRQVAYPDDRRRYFKKGDPILLLNYTNDPYRLVYDTIKVIDAQNAIGVMHLGTFPNGLEFAAFVMARNNYLFENMSIEDHQLLFADPRNTAPAIAQLAGPWSGHVILAPTTDTLLNQATPPPFQVSFAIDGQEATAQYRVGPAQFSQTLNAVGLQNDMRAIDVDTIVGKCVAPALPGVASLLTPITQMFHFLLRRA